ncbi:MAG: exonuclease domain-containing protein [Candidatus Omnitrophota bacterium]
MKLEKPLVILDLETTGTWIEKDRIIEIAMILCLPDKTMKEYVRRINPEMIIPTEVVQLTGITNEIVKGCPRFREVAHEILEFLGDSELGGFNVERFDLPLLEREFSDIGIVFKWRERKIYDAQKVYHLNEKRDLAAAYAFYCGEVLEDAHSALADTRATLKVLEAQVERYGCGEDRVDALDNFDYKMMGEFYDCERRFRWWNGELYMMFGKYARKKTLKDIARDDPRYLEWILSADFSTEVKELVSAALEGKFPQYPAQ